MTTDWYAPNQQAVRADESGPAEEGEGGSGVAGNDDEGFDPGEHTIGDVQAYVEEYPEERDTVRAAEEDGKARVTLLEWLDAFEG